MLDFGEGAPSNNENGASWRYNAWQLFLFA